MKSTLIVTVSALALVALSTGCGADAEPEAASPSQSGYGYEFNDDNVLAASAAKASPMPSSIGAGVRLAPELIQQAVRADADALKGCYDEAVKRDPAATGKVRVRFGIQADGAVTGARDEGSTTKDPVLVSCVVGAVSAVRFPASSAGPVAVIYPFTFSR